MPECKNVEVFRKSHTISFRFLQRIIKELELHSLKKIIIAGSESDAYSSALQRYGSELDHHIVVTNSDGLSGAAVVIHGIVPNGSIEQIVFIKDFLYMAFVEDLLNYEHPTTDDKFQLNIGFYYIFHELGHVVEYQTSFETYGYCSPDKVFYLRYEYKEYILGQAMQLWSEYFAESLAVAVAPNATKNSIGDIIEYLNRTVYPDELPAQLNHSYFVAYFLVHYLASLHYRGENLPSLTSIENNSILAGYQEPFEIISETLLDLYARRGEWNFQDDSLRFSEAYSSLIIYERNAYSL